MVGAEGQKEQRKKCGKKGQEGQAGEKGQIGQTGPKKKAKGLRRAVIAKGGNAERKAGRTTERTEM